MCCAPWEMLDPEHSGLFPPPSHLLSSLPPHTPHYARALAGTPGSVAPGWAQQMDRRDAQPVSPGIPHSCTHTHTPPRPPCVRLLPSSPPGFGLAPALCQELSPHSMIQENTQALTCIGHWIQPDLLPHWSHPPGRTKYPRPHSDLLKPLNLSLSASLEIHTRPQAWPSTNSTVAMSNHTRLHPLCPPMPGLCSVVHRALCGRPDGLLWGHGLPYSPSWSPLLPLSKPSLPPQTTDPASKVQHSVPCPSLLHLLS